MGEDLAVVGAGARHGVRAVLAHAYAVAVAVDGEGEAAVGVGKLKIGRAQLEQRAQLAAGERNAADNNARNAAGRRANRLAEPGVCVAGHVRLGLEI